MENTWFQLDDYVEVLLVRMTRKLCQGTQCPCHGSNLEPAEHRSWCAGLTVGHPLRDSSSILLPYAVLPLELIASCILKLRSSSSQFSVYILPSFVSDILDSSKSYSLKLNSRSVWVHLSVQIRLSLALNTSLVSLSKTTFLLRPSAQPLYMEPSLKFGTCSEEWGEP
jgi:hypothetical protein